MIHSLSSLTSKINRDYFEVSVLGTKPLVSYAFIIYFTRMSPERGVGWGGGGSEEENGRKNILVFFLPSTHLQKSLAASVSKKVTNNRSSCVRLYASQEEKSEDREQFPKSL